ncbi:MAG: cytochrome-c peroxidase, partial [Chloroflexota bacterium]
MKLQDVLISVFAVFSVLLLGAGILLLDRPGDMAEPVLIAETQQEIVDEAIQPIPLTIDLDERKVALGRDLFHDTLLSADGTVSCASCHTLSHGGVDGSQVSTGINGTSGIINAPTVYNSAFNFRQFWDGRADTLEDQINGPLSNPGEMGTDWKTVLARLNADTDYRQAFGAIYPDGVTRANTEDALAVYQRSLITPNSRFDRYLRGDHMAITPEEKEGYRLFRAYGCIACHQGTNVGGNLYQRFGIMADYFADRGNITIADLGRYNTTGREEDRHVFKVPGLRNVALTAPYFHDGTAENLHEAVRTMGYYQLGRDLT